MSPLIPMWIIGASGIGLLLLSFMFPGRSAMGSEHTRESSRIGADPYLPNRPLDPPAHQPRP